MPMNVEIVIKGIALCFAKRDVWNIDFLCDDEHSLAFTDPGGQPEPLRVAGKDIQIAFSSDGITPANPAMGPHFSDVFNMAAKYAHGDLDAGGNKILRENRVKDKTDLVRVILPSATLDTVRWSQNPYYVQEASTIGLPPMIIGSVASVVFGEFTVDKAGNDLIMRSDEAGSQPRQYPYVEGSTLRFEFDNDCIGACSTNDFLGVYELIQDGSGRKVAAGQVKSVSVNGERLHRSLMGTGFTQIGTETAESLVMTPDSGNCDPIGCDPPPGD